MTEENYCSNCEHCGGAVAAPEPLVADGEILCCADCGAPHQIHVDDQHNGEPIDVWIDPVKDIEDEYERLVEERKRFLMHLTNAEESLKMMGGLITELREETLKLRTIRDHN